MNFFKLYIGDYQRDTGTLSVTEHGAYMLMLQHYYATEQPLPEGRELHRLLRAESKADRDAIDNIARKFWSQTDGGLVNLRAQEEIKKSEHQRTVNREIGKRGGRPKRTEQITDSVTDSVSIREPNRNPNQTPDTRHQIPTVGNISTHPEISQSDGGGVCDPNPPSPEVLAAIGLRKLGVRITPQNPELIASVAEGVTTEALIAMAEAYPGKPAGYVISACRRQRAEAANPSAAARASPPGKPSIAQQFAEKNYQGTPDDQLPEYLRTHSA